MAIIQSLDNQSKFNPLWNQWLGRRTEAYDLRKVRRMHFGGVKWDAPLMSNKSFMPNGSLKGCYCDRGGEGPYLE